ncbi:MAG: hypothetical protein AB4372_15930, partial [Xenococcus sp. (in: cyanobacteria)]
SGHCHISVELTTPSPNENATVYQGIVNDIKKRFNIDSPNFNALNYNPGATASLLLIGNVTGVSDTTEITASASEYGSNTASFTFDLSKTMLDTLKKVFAKKGGTYKVVYHLSVPARLPAVTATLTFNSALAYQYQVTHAQHHTWSKDTPRSVQKILNESQSSHVDIKWGIANPSEDLRKAVSDWANQTLQDRITAQVNEALKVLGTENYDSFNISSVSSFTDTYSENEVINWFISPSVVLPSLTDLDKNINHFSATVDARQQVMTISAHLPFTKDSADAPNVPLVDSKPALVDQVVVTVTYPGLSENDGTYTFTKNGSQVFTAPYDATHGGSYDLTYRATFKNSTSTVSGNIPNISQAAYQLQIESVGILTIQFDAHQAFAKTGGQKNTLQEVDIAFSFANSSGPGNPIQQNLKIKSTDSPPIGKITSYTDYPIDSTYNYTTTYIFEDQKTFPAATQNNKSGFSQIIPAVAGPHILPLYIIIPPADASDPTKNILNATVQLWYKEPPKVPGTANLPTQDNPAVFSLKPAQGSTGYSVANDNFSTFINSDVPIIYSASLITEAVPIDITNKIIEGHLATLSVNATVRYFTLKVDPITIDWKQAQFFSVDIEVDASRQSEAKSTKSPLQKRSITWNKNEKNIRYLTWPITDGDKVSYSWTATYKFSGQSTVKTKTGNDQTSLILTVPAHPD